MNEQQLPALFDPVAPYYDGWFQTPLGALCFRWELETILRAAQPRPGERVLDVGCGTGIFTAQFARQGARVTGLDVSSQMLAVARKRASQEGLSIELRQGQAEKLPFPDASFDVALSVTVLEFVEAPAAVVAEMARVVRPGGRLVVAALSSRGLWALQRRLSKQETIYSHARFFSPTQLRRLLEPVGEVSLDACVFVPPWYWRPVGRLHPLWEAIGRHLWKGLGAFLVARCLVANGTASRGQAGGAE